MHIAALLDRNNSTAGVKPYRLRPIAQNDRPCCVSALVILPGMCSPSVVPGVAFSSDGKLVHFIFRHRTVVHHRYSLYTSHLYLWRAPSSKELLDVAEAPSFPGPS